MESIFRKLLRTCESWSPEDKVNNTAILDPGKLNFTVLQGQGQQCVDYMCYAMHRCSEDSKKFILLPYHQRYDSNLQFFSMF
jgi:hypothetical protein